jgi:ABC-2 type transport system ATP-binding protein
VRAVGGCHDEDAEGGIDFMPTHSDDLAGVQVNLPSGSTLLAITPILVVILGTVVFSLVDLVRARSVRYLPKVVWGVIIVLVSTPLGAIAYLVFGRPRRSGASPSAATAAGSPDNDRARSTGGTAVPGPIHASTGPGPSNEAARVDQTEPTVIQTVGLTRDYGSGGLYDVDLSVPRGSVYGLVGPNGAGKTTTLRILATLLVPDRGDAEIAGASVRRNPNDVRRVLGFMPDSFGVYDDMKVWEYLDFFARCYGIPAERRRRMIGDLLELVDLGPKRDVYVQGLSRGMQQRLCLAHTLVHDPQVLLLDEPASGLDPRARVELRELLRELRAMGKTILVSSHILPELEELCTSVAIIDRGQVLAQGRVADIEKRLRVGAVLRARVLGDRDGVEAAQAWFAGQPDVVTAEILPDGQIEIGFHGDDDGSAALLAHAVVAGLRVASFARAASDLEELFLQVTAAEPMAEPPPAPPPAAVPA